MPFALSADPFRSLAIAYSPGCSFRFQHRGSSVYWYEFKAREDIEEALDEQIQQGYRAEWCGCPECTRVASAEGAESIPAEWVERQENDGRLSTDSWWYRKNLELELQQELLRLVQNASRLAALTGQANHQIFEATLKQFEDHRASISRLKREI